MEVGRQKAPKRWTEAEDRILREEAQKQTSTGGVKDWLLIAERLPNRSNKDCRKRWVNTVNGSVKKGAWNKDEVRRLVAAVNKHGQRWALVANDVGLRSPDQCAKQWKHKLDPKLEHKVWTEEEDKRFLALVERHGRKWKFIQEQNFIIRSTNDLKNRYTTLSRKQNSGSAYSRQQGVTNSPSTARAPDKEPGKIDLGIVEDGVLMENREAIDYEHGPVYALGEVSDRKPDSILDPITPSTAAFLASPAFPPIDSTILGEGDNIDTSFRLMGPNAHQSIRVDFETGGESLYTEATSSIETGSSDERQCQLSPHQMHDSLGGYPTWGMPQDHCKNIYEPDLPNVLCEVAISPTNKCQTFYARVEVNHIGLKILNYTYPSQPPHGILWSNMGADGEESLMFGHDIGISLDTSPLYGGLPNPELTGDALLLKIFQPSPTNRYSAELLERWGRNVPPSQILRHVWADVVVQYSRCQLTFASDKLIAVSGIARYFQSLRPDDVYIAGLWASSLAAEMTWHRPYSDPRVPDFARNLAVAFQGHVGYRAPSFSWAAIDFPVRAGDPFADGILVTVTCIQYRQDAGALQEPITKSTFGPISTPVVEAQVQGCLKTTTIRKWGDRFYAIPTHGEVDASDSAVSDDGKSIPNLWPISLDTELDAEGIKALESRVFYYVPWQVDNTSAVPKFVALFLDLVDPGMARYRRIGIMRCEQLLLQDLYMRRQLEEQSIPCDHHDEDFGTHGFYII